MLEVPEFNGVEMLQYTDKVVENMSDAVFVLDAQAHIVDVNLAAQKLVGCSFKAVVGQPLAQVLGIDLDFATDLKIHTEIILNKKTEPRCYDLHSAALLNQQKELTGWLIFLHDVTAYKQLEKKQQDYAQQNARLFQEEQRQCKIAESLRQSLLTLSSSLDHVAIIAEILAQVRQLIQYDSAAFFLQDGDSLRLSNGVGFDYAVVNTRIPLGSHNRTVQAFKQQQTKVIPDVRVDPYWKPFSANEQVHSAVAAPLVIGGQTIGVLTVDRFEPQAFTDEDAKILQAFANQAAVAFNNAQLHQQAQTAAALEERHRLAQDLHDAINQTLFSAALIAEALPDIWQEDVKHGKQVLEELRLLTQGALAEMRTLLLELRPAALTEKNFSELLQHLVTAFTNRNRIPVDLTIDGGGFMPPETQIVFYRIVQEALINITKHARASHVTINFSDTSSQTILTISDNGRGFNTKQIPVGHFGVTIMKERADKIGAQFQITAKPARGTQVMLIWHNEG